MRTITSRSVKQKATDKVDLETFDVRHLRNPHNVEPLRPLDGRHERVKEFMLGDPGTGAVLGDAMRAAMQGKDIEFVCVGGRHRSVALAELLAHNLRFYDENVIVQHRALTVSAH